VTEANSIPSDPSRQLRASSGITDSISDFRKECKIIQEAKHLLALAYTNKSMAHTTPTSTEVGNTSVPDDSAEAVRLLGEMAEKQHRTFEQVFADPKNRTLAARTYTEHHRPTASSTSGSELQRR
jgi:hypothetical protein